MHRTDFKAVGESPPRRRFHHDYDAEEYAPRVKIYGQRPVDFYSTAIRYVQTRHLYNLTPYGYHVPAHEYFTKDLLACTETNFNPSTALCTQWVSTSFHPDARSSRVRVPLYGLEWAPNGRRLLCSTARGEFLLFNGRSFGLEVKTVAHEDRNPCRAIAWGARTDLILSGDDAGNMKVWRSNFVLMAEFESNHRIVREITWAPLEAKFCSSGQDGTARVWDTQTVGSHNNIEQPAREEVKLEGHGGDVTTVHWHSYRSLIATGSQDMQCRLWDPRTAARGSIAALYGHSQPITCVRWHPDGRTLLSSSKDGTIKLWDIRKTQPELIRFKGHSDSVDHIEWHPVVGDLFASCGGDGRIMYWMVDESEGTPTHGILEAIKDAATIEAAHDRFREKANPVFTLAWCPLGNLLASCRTEVKYWSRNKPGALEEKERGVEDEDILEDDANTV